MAEKPSKVCFNVLLCYCIFQTFAVTLSSYYVIDEKVGQIFTNHFFGNSSSEGFTIHAFNCIVCHLHKAYLHRTVWNADISIVNLLYIPGLLLYLGPDFCGISLQESFFDHDIMVFVYKWKANEIRGNCEKRRKMNFWAWKKHSKERKLKERKTYMKKETVEKSPSAM